MRRQDGLEFAIMGRREEISMRSMTWLVLGGLFGAACSSGQVTDSGAVNSLPSIEGVEIQPLPVVEASEIECVAVGWFDPDGDPPLYVLEWKVNGESVGSSAKLTGDNFNKEDEVACELTPLDAGGEGESKSVSVVVENSLPTANSVEIDPLPLSVESTARVVINGESDDDNDAVVWSHVWFVNDEQVSSEPLLSGNSLTRGDLVHAESTPDDGDEYGVPLLAPSVEVGNALPSVLSVSIYPAVAAPTDLLSAIVSTGDSDGDSVSVSYEWLVNGVEVGNESTLTDAFGVGDNVLVRVRPNDGIDDGAEVDSDPVVVAQT